MAPLRSLGNTLSAFKDFYARTGTDAVTPPSAFSATGGNTVTTITGYKVHIFTSPGNFIASGGSSPVEYLVVAGGGSGGGEYGGGGGAGGLRTNLSGHPLAGASMTITPGTYPVTVGAGGVHVSPSATRGVTGSDSVFNGITSYGGGGGGAPQGAGRDGGSGGGGGAQDAPSSNKGTGNTPPLSPPQGNPGGTGAYQNGPRSGGGGGGAGAAGDNATDPECGDGGIGVQVLIAGNPSPIGTTGPTPGGGWFAGGGGGGGYSSTPGTGGAGGGANGGGSSAPDATANTGGGGGGANHPNAANGGDGGSGIVVVRYPT